MGCYKILVSSYIDFFFFPFFNSSSFKGIFRFKRKGKNHVYIFDAWMIFENDHILYLVQFLFSFLRKSKKLIEVNSFWGIEVDNFIFLFYFIAQGKVCFHFACCTIKYKIYDNINLLREHVNRMYYYS